MMGGLMDRSCSRLISGLVIRIAIVSALSPAIVAAEVPSRQQLESLLKEAKDARHDAEEALLRAKTAEKKLADLLALDDPPADTTQPHPDSVQAGEPARMDCIRGDTVCPSNVPKGYDLLAYPSEGEEDRNEWAETRLTNYLSKEKGGKKVSFARIDQPFVSRISFSKGDEALDAQYLFPLSRRRLPVADGVRIITTSLGFGLSASFDSDNKNVGLIARGGSFADDRVTASITFGRQYYPSKLHRGGKGTLEEQAKGFASALVDRCKTAQKAEVTNLTTSSSKPAGCDSLNLLDWSFDPDDAERFKMNVDAYNRAFWEPGEKELPEYGFGLSATVGMQNFKYILPSEFLPGIIPDPQVPTFLSTLLAESKDGSKPDLGQQEARRFSPSVGGHLFYLLEGRWLVFDGLLIRESATLARRWDIEEKFANKEYCALKVGPVGECKKFNIAAPQAHVSFEPSLNLRTRIDLGFGRYGPARYFAKIGLSPAITFNSHKDSYRLVVPAFLGADKDGQLTGGIQFARDFGSEDPDENVSVWSVFLSTPFSMDGSKN